MAYITVSISGNEEFGGYLSVDGAESFAVQDGYVYQLDNGPHFFQLHTTTDAQRKAGERQRAVNNLVGSGAMGVLSDIQSTAAIGRTWEFHAEAWEGQCLELSILSEGRSINVPPRFAVVECTEEEIEEYEGIFAEFYAEQEAEREREAEERAERERKAAQERERLKTTPRRSKKLLIPGIIISAICALGILAYGSMLLSAESVDPADPTSMTLLVAIGVLGVGLIVGLILLFSGAKKKIRK